MTIRQSRALSGVLLVLCSLLAACEGGADTEPLPPSEKLITAVTSHGDQDVVKSSPITVTGTVSDSGARVTVAGVSATLSGTTFSASVPLVSGNNRITIEAQAGGRTESTSLSVTLNSTEMCGAGDTFTVPLPGVAFPDDPSTRNLAGRRLPDDSVTLPAGCAIYAFFVHGYGRNETLDELMFYKLAKFVAENNGYTHWSWWNNLLGEYMSRPLHGGNGDYDPDPGNLILDGLAFTLPEGRGKGKPDDDFQFQSDIQRVLEAVRAQNPDAVIIVAGHSMGGNATARAGFNATVDIDLLAPIDPVGNRNLPDGVGGALEYQLGIRSPTPGTLAYTPGNETYNWTRWRATREFRGYKQRDCIRTSLGLCRDFDDRLFHTEYRCRLLPENGWLEHPPFIYTFAPIKCPRSSAQGPVRDSGIPIAFRPNIKRLYHRWQQEYFFPYDYHADDPDHRILGIPSPIRANYVFGSSASRSTSIFGANYQAPVPENPPGERDPDKTCADNGELDPRGAVSFGGNALVCRRWDGHGEIIGIRAVTGISSPTNGNLQPLALKARPFDNPRDSWFDTDDAQGRKDALVAMATSFDPDTGADTWPHRPVNPDLDLVVDDLVLIAQDILARGAPGGDDTTPPSSSANPDTLPNEHGWNNSDVVITISAVDEQGGSGVGRIDYEYSGAEAGSGVVEGDSVQILLGAEGETTIVFFATDNAGNAEEPNTLVVRIDKTPPVISAVVDPEPNEHGWNNTDVTVTFEATDALSGIDTVTEPVTVTEEGAGHEVVGEAVDRAGNSSTVGVILNIDKTPPVIVGLPENCSLWPPNHKLVEVAEIVAADDLSGIDTMHVDAISNEPESGPGYGNAAPDVVITDGLVELRAERYSPGGRQYDVTAAATDLAGNTADGDAVCIVVHDQGNGT